MGLQHLEKIQHRASSIEADAGEVDVDDAVARVDDGKDGVEALAAEVALGEVERHNFVDVLRSGRKLAEEMRAGSLEVLLAQLNVQVSNSRGTELIFGEVFNRVGDWRWSFGCGHFFFFLKNGETGGGREEGRKGEN